MNKNDFVKLLEQYKNKALGELEKEAKVAAAALIPSEFHELSQKCDELVDQLKAAYVTLSNQFSNIKGNNPEFKYAHLYCSIPDKNIAEKAISTLQSQIIDSTAFRKKELKIRNKFDAAIRSAKSTKSSKKLMDLAVALGIEVDSIEIDGDVSTAIDTPFLKEKIQSVKLLK